MEITYRLSPPVTDEQLNCLYGDSWPAPAEWCELAPILERSLAYVCAYDGERLVGFVYLAWDGGSHAFLLDPTVRSEWRRQGIGRELVRRAVEAARERGAIWVHVDYEPHLRGFYERCGFRPTLAGLIRL